MAEFVHILSGGLALCGAGSPREWPSGHYWVSIEGWEAEEPSCSECVRVAKAHDTTSAGARYADLTPQEGSK